MHTEEHSRPVSNQMGCPYCDGTATLAQRPAELAFRKETFRVSQQYYLCSSCQEEFTTNAADALTLAQVHNQYRERHHIPFPEEIIALRESYDLSAAKMSEVLGLGANGYGNYEKGEMPNEGYGNLIRLASDPRVFRVMLLGAQDHFSEASFQRALAKVEALVKEREQPAVTPPLDAVQDISSLNGYRRISKSKAIQAMLYFLQYCAEGTTDKLKLNKLLFYADFLNYRTSGHSITGISYRAIPYGPAPSHFDYLFAYLVREGFMESVWQPVMDKPVEVLVGMQQCQTGIFTPVELQSLDRVMDAFGFISSWDLVNLSHEEAAWKDLHQERKLIDYQQYAFGITGI